MISGLVLILFIVFIASNLAAFAFGTLSADRARRSIPWLQRSTSAQLALISVIIAASRPAGSSLAGFATFVAAGMCVSFAADLIMASQIPSPGRVILGMVVFAIAHGLYLAGMLSGPAATSNLSMGTFLASEAALLLTGLAIWAGLVRSPNAPNVLNAGSLGYLAALATMTALAVALAVTDPRWTALAAGALLFMASDAVLGNQLFRRNVWPYSSDVVWGIYICGQALITLSTLAAGG